MIDRRWRILFVLTFARLSMGFQFQSIGATAPRLAEHMGLAMADVGMLVGLYLVPGIVLALPGGVLGARFGDRRVAVAGLAAMTAGGLVLAVADDLALAIAGRLLSGAGATLMNVMLMKMVADWFTGRELVLAMSVLVNSWPIGIGIALLTLGALADATSPQAAFAATSAFAIVGMATLLWRYRAPPGAALAAAPDLRAIDARTWRLLVVGSAPWMFYNAAFAIVVAFVPTWLARAGLDLGRAGGFTAINTLLIVVSIQVGGMLAQRAFRTGAIVGAGLLGWGASLLALAQGDALLVWLVVGGLFAGLPAGALVALPAQFLPPQLRSTGMGVFSSITNAGMALAPPLAGWVADRAGTAAAPLPVAVAAIAATTIAWVATQRMLRGAADRAPADKPYREQASPPRSRAVPRR